MPTYNRKPTSVTATQWNAHGDHPAVGANLPLALPATGSLLAQQTKTIVQQVEPGDWIVEDAMGAIYKVPNGLFVKIYEAATTSA